MNGGRHAQHKGVETTTRVTSRDDLSLYASRLLEELPSHDNRATVLALYGELGAGKTAFVQEVARHLGVLEQVTSPTFVIMKSYDVHTKNSFRRLIHIDAYRIENVDELKQLRFSEVLATPRTLVCIEWANRVAAAIPNDAARLTILGGDDGVRTMTYAKT